MIIVKISGGIGNQLFQYSFGRYIETNYSIPVSYDLKTQQNNSSFTNRLPLIKELIPTITLYNKKLHISDSVYRIQRKIIQSYFPNFTEVYVENLSKNQTIDLNTIKNKHYFDGYWQSLKYIKSIEKIIKNEIKFSNKILELCISDLIKIKNTNSCSIHIRRGDYLLSHNAKIFSKCDIDFYEKSVNYILKKIPDTIFFIFSDDILWARKYFTGQNYIFIDKYFNDPIVDFYLMSNCQNNIISNSTFSWWASWLNENNAKLIISPRQWLNNPIQNERLLENIIDKSHILI